MSPMSALDKTIQALSSRAARPLFRFVMRGRATVFMLHREQDSHPGVSGHSIEYIHEALGALRRSGARLVSLRKLVESYRNGSGPGDDWVAFTIDDGFADQVQLARDGFAACNCPVTIFLISDFLDGKLWPWDDQVTYILNHSPLESLDITLLGETLNLPLKTEQQRAKAVSRVRARIKASSNDNLYETIAGIAKQAQVSVPAQPPPAYRPMTWAQARELESMGVEFGPHSITHRIFSRISDGEACREIEGSWARLQQELHSPLPVFAWPTGHHRDYTVRDMKLAKAAGLHAAVATGADYSYLNPKADLDGGLWALRRFSLPLRVRDVLQYGSWIERGKQLVRERIQI